MKAVPTLFDGQPAVELEAPDGAHATVLLHGAQLVSWVPAGGREQLYLSGRTRHGAGAAVRGGVPVVFPQFAARGTLPRHGLLRTRAWSLAEALTRARHAQAVLRFVADDDTLALWPHEFEAELTISIAGPQLDIEFAVANTGDRPFDFCTALHTYLRTDDVLKAQLEGLQGVKYEDGPSGQWQQQWGDVTQVIGAIDRIYHDVPQSLTLREAGRQLTVASAGYTDAVVWNPGPDGEPDDMPPGDWLHMLCVEAARVIEPIRLEPGAEWVGLQTLACA